MMKHAFLLLAFAALAVSLPSDVPETFVEVATAESILPPVADVMDVVSPKVSLVQVTAADHEQARAKVTALLQQGNDQSACSQMAQNALDEVTAAVKAQQDALDEMDKGANCDGAGDQHKEDAKTAKENAATTLQQAKETLAAAQSTTVDLGSYKWSQLNPQSCASLFDIEGYTSVTKAVNDAQSAVNAAQGVLDDATQHVEDAVQKAADMVTECKCKVMEEQAAALEKMNKDAKEANTKTWNQAKLMQCVLDGTSESNCDLGTIPVVTETELADGVSDTFCSGLPFKAKLGARNGVPPREYTFRLAQVNPSNNYGDDFRTVSKEECRKIGMLPVCDHPSYCKDDANAMYLGQDHHISHGSHMQNNGYFPSGWNEIKKEFYGTCMYSFNANGPHSLCNNDASGNGNGFLEAGGNPWGSHAWLRPSQTQGNGKDGKPNRARFFMCAKINHRTFKVALGAKNGVPARTVAFKMITAMDKATGEIDRNMIKDCNAVGMKPVCDHPNYCKNNADSFYVGQDHHFAHSPHRRTVSYYPSGWQTFVNDYYPETRGICAFTAEHNGWASTLCNGYGDSHEWRTSAQDHEFMCAKDADALPPPPPPPLSAVQWDQSKAASGTTVSSDGSTWTQGSGHAWQGVASAEGMCHSGTGIHAWVVTVVKGTYHQIGIAQADWDGTGTSSSNSHSKFAFLYSHSTGWNRHRGAAQPVGTPSANTWWSGTWDSHNKGSQFTVTLDCKARTFEVKSEQQKLGTMSYPSSWGVVYAAAAGQSSDHVYQLQLSTAQA